jgi:hypothetical protein
MRKGPGDLHHLLLGNGEGAHLAGGIQIQIDGVEDLPGSAVQAPPVDGPAALQREGLQEDILGHGELRNQGQLLENHLDALAQGIVGAVQLQRRAFK